jgi:hypothetical protein
MSKTATLKRATLKRSTLKTSTSKTNYFSSKDLEKILKKLFAHSSNCDDVVRFMKENTDLLSKTVKKNDYGLLEGSSVFHILAQKSFDSTIVTGYKYKVGFLKDFFSDIQEIIMCLYKNINNDELINSLRSLNVLGKLAGGKTALEIAKSEPPNIYLVEIMEKLEHTEEPIAIKNDSAIIENPQISRSDSINLNENKEEIHKTLAPNLLNKSTKENHHPTDVLTFSIEKRIITNIKTSKNRITIKTLSPYKSLDKGYKLTRTFRKTALKNSKK